MPGPVTIRPVRVSDLPEIADLHRRVFPESAITAAGAAAVRRYYQWQCAPVHDVVNLVAVQDGTIAGFCFGGAFQGAMSGFLRRNRWFLLGAFAVRPWVLLRPAIRGSLVSGLRDVVRAARRSGRPAAQARPDAVFGRSFGILAIAASPGAGIGRRLMDVAEEQARRQGYRRMNLSVRPDNAAAIGFYEAIGWRKVMVGGTWRGHMERALDAGQHERGHSSVS